MVVVMGSPLSESDTHINQTGSHADFPQNKAYAVKLDLL
jgi:hypothetical protein